MTKFKTGDWVKIIYNPYKTEVIFEIEKILTFDENNAPLMVEIRPIQEFETPKGFISKMFSRTEDVKDLESVLNSDSALEKTKPRSGD